MPELKSSSLADFLYNRKLPQVYRDMDSPTEGYPLKRYIHSLIEGGFTDILTKCNDLTVLVDPENCPDEYFPFLYESFGYTFDPSVDIIYQRRILINHGDLVQRRGTVSYVRFLVRALTGLDCNIESVNKVLTITLLAKSLDELRSMETSVAVVQKFIENQLPFFEDLNDVISAIKVQVIPAKTYTYNVLTTCANYTIGKK
jgi:phage tail-like protein